MDVYQDETSLEENSQRQVNLHSGKPHIVKNEGNRNI